MNSANYGQLCRHVANNSRFTVYDQGYNNEAELYNCFFRSISFFHLCRVRNRWLHTIMYRDALVQCIQPNLDVLLQDTDTHHTQITDKTVQLLKQSTYISYTCCVRHPLFLVFAWITCKYITFKLFYEMMQFTLNLVSNYVLMKGE